MIMGSNMNSFWFNSNRQVQWLNAYYFQYLFYPFVYTSNNIIHLHTLLCTLLAPKKNHRKELMSWQHATISGTYNRKYNFYLLKKNESVWLFRVTHEHMSTNTHIIYGHTHRPNHCSSNWQCQSNDAIDFISVQYWTCSIINVFTALFVITIIEAILYEASVHAKRFQAQPSHMNIHEANVHVSTSYSILLLNIDAIFCSTCRTQCMRKPSSINDVVHGIRTWQYKSEYEWSETRRRENNNNHSWREERKRMNKRQCANNNQNQTKRQKSLFVCALTTMCVVCIHIKSHMKICAICWLILFFFKLRK